MLAGWNLLNKTHLIFIISTCISIYYISYRILILEYNIFLEEYDNHVKNTTILVLWYIIAEMDALHSITFKTTRMYY